MLLSHECARELQLEDREREEPSVGVRIRTGSVWGSSEWIFIRQKARAWGSWSASCFCSCALNSPSHTDVSKTTITHSHTSDLTRVYCHKVIKSVLAAATVTSMSRVLTSDNFYFYLLLQCLPFTTVYTTT